MGKAIKALDKEQGPFTNFRRITNPYLDQIDASLFVGQEDLQCLVDFAIGIHKGRIPARYEFKRPVPLHDARSYNSLNFP